jgi:hypothetical protein
MTFVRFTYYYKTLLGEIYISPTVLESVVFVLEPVMPELCQSGLVWRALGGDRQQTHTDGSTALDAY